MVNCKQSEIHFEIMEGLFEKDGWKLLSSHSHESVYTETLVMEIPNSGCIVRVITLLEPDGEYHVADSITFVPWAKISEIRDDEGNLTGRKLINFNKL